MKKWLWIGTSGILVLLITALLFAGNYLYSQSVARGTEVELYRGSETSEPVNAPPSNTADSVVTESQKWFDAQDVAILEQTSFDELTLKAGFIDNEQSKGRAVILAHGFRKQKEDMQDLAFFYYQQGFDILIPDARGHGESEGDYIGYGWHDRLDYQQWIERLIADFDTDTILLHGQSMGAALVLMLSGEDLPEEVKGIIADSGYTSVKEELAYQLKHIYGLPSFPLLNVTSFITKIRSGYTFEEASAINQVKHNKRPLFIIHGEDDELVPTEMAYDIYDAAGGEKKLWTVPGAGHIQAYDTAPGKFENKILTFISSSLNKNEIK